MSIILSKIITTTTNENYFEYPVIKTFRVMERTLKYRESSDYEYGTNHMRDPKYIWPVFKDKMSLSNYEWTLRNCTDIHRLGWMRSFMIICNLYNRGRLFMDSSMSWLLFLVPRYWRECDSDRQGMPTACVDWIVSFSYSCHALPFDSSFLEIKLEVWFGIGK